MNGEIVTGISVHGLVLRAVNLKESDRLLTVYTEEMGLMTLSARGARSMKSRKLSATQPFCYALFTLSKQGNYYHVSEADLIESFFTLRATLEGMALAGYLCEVLATVGTTDPEPELLRLTLNSLYAIAQKKAPLIRIKAAYEMRLMSVIGFMPDVSGCRLCGERNGEFYFDIMDGHLTCAACHEKAMYLPPEEDDGHERHILAILSEGAKFAMDFAIHCPVEKILAFRIDENDARVLSAAAESYTVNHLERSFGTLDFYHEVENDNDADHTENT